MAGAGARAAQGGLSPAPQAGPGLGSPPPRSLRSPPPSGTGRSKPLLGARGTSWPQPPRVLMESPNLYPVKLYVYDLSKGLARRLSPIMLGEGAGRGREGRPGPGERVPARPAQVGRPGRDAGRRRGAQRWRKTQVKKGGVCGFGPLTPTSPPSCLNQGRRDGKESRPLLALQSPFIGVVG